MYLFAIVALSLVVLLSLTGNVEANRTVDFPIEHQQAVIQVDQYRAFLFAADMYMKSNPPAVTVPTAIKWDVIKANPLVAPGAVSVAIPSTWKIVRKPDNTWVACTEIPQRSISAIWQIAPPLTTSSGVSSPGMTPVNLSGVSSPGMTPVNLDRSPEPTHIVVGDPVTANAEAKLCL